MSPDLRPSIVVLGTGFAAFSFVKKIDVKLFDVTIVSPRNHFLFTPLLPSTTVGTVEFRSIIEPIRVARSEVRYIQAYSRSADLQRKAIVCEGTADAQQFKLSYEYLVIAVGSKSNTYGIPGVEQHTLPLKELADARAIRQRIIECFENAASPSVSDDERRRLLHFVVVGGGPTGVEFAAEMNDFLVDDLRKVYPGLLAFVQITVLEGAHQLLGTFDETLQDYTRRMFLRQRIDVRTDSLVVRVEKEKIILQDGSAVPFGLAVWTTGIGPREFVQQLTIAKDRIGRIITNEMFQAKDSYDVYALGDCGTVEGKNYPATAQVAQQEGAYLAKALKQRVLGKSVQPFRYKHYGMLAYIGGERALADLESFKGKGFSTWLFWRSAYLTRLVSVKNKVLVLFDWFKTFVFGRDISRF
ncbi:MAG: FAD-dependent oxidoreductase [Ignavibacteriae bacterium]|nr:FAD-dependent oxidoreductase [Ignavibacteriota bacterium]